MKHYRTAYHALYSAERVIERVESRVRELCAAPGGVRAVCSGRYMVYAARKAMQHKRRRAGRPIGEAA